MPQTLHLSKSTISLPSLQIGQKIEFTLSPPFIKLWKQVSIPLIVMSDPEESCVEYEWLQNKNCKDKKIKEKGNTHTTILALRIWTNSFTRTLPKPLLQIMTSSPSQSVISFSTNSALNILSYSSFSHTYKNNSTIDTIKPSRLKTSMLSWISWMTDRSFLIWPGSLMGELHSTDSWC